MGFLNRQLFCRMMLSLCEKGNPSCEGKAYCHIAKENAVFALNTNRKLMMSSYIVSVISSLITSCATTRKTKIRSHNSRQGDFRK